MNAIIGGPSLFNGGIRTNEGFAKDLSWEPNKTGDSGSKAKYAIHYAVASPL